MRVFVALSLVTSFVISFGSAAVTAGDPVLAPPSSSNDSAPGSSYERNMPVEEQVNPPSAQGLPSYETSPPGSFAAHPPMSSPHAYQSMPRPSYEDVASRYPAPAHPLVPSALYGGPVFVGSGSYGGASAGGMHVRFPYYNYRSPWTSGGPVSFNHTIIW